MFKRVFSVLLIAALMLGVFAVIPASAEEITSGDWQYWIDENGNAVLHRYLGSDADVTVPSEIDGHRVDMIIESFFTDWDVTNETIVSVTVPEGVTRLGGETFCNCVNLERVILPESLISVGGAAFYRCYSLKSIVIPDKVSRISDSAFSGCRSLESVTLGKKLKMIGENAFYGCDSLKEITVPDSVNEIGDRALGWTSKSYSGTIMFMNTDLLIKGGKDSEAQRYAKQHGLRFEEIESEPADEPGETFEPDPDKLYVKLSDDSYFEVERNEGFDLVFFTVSPQPVGSVWGGMSFDDVGFSIVDGEVCYSSDDEGALMSGDLDTDGIVEFSVSPTVKDKSLFESFIEDYETDGGETVSAYLQPIVRLRMKLNADPGVYDFKWYLMCAQDINGALLYDADEGFQEDGFIYGVTGMKAGAEPAAEEPTEPAIEEPAEPASEVSRGDLNGDGEVTNRDAMILDRYVAGWNGYEKNIKDMNAADLNGDGEVTNRDAMILDRYVAGWRGYAKYVTGEEDPVLPTEPSKPTEASTEPPTEAPTEAPTQAPTEPPTEAPTEAPTEPAAPAVPKITKAESGNNGVTVTWDAFEGAELYRVFYKTGTASWKKLGDTASTTFTHKDAPYNVECTYTVRCVDKAGNFTSDYDKDGYKNTRLNDPKLTSAKLLEYYIGVSWEKVEGARYYCVFIKGGKFDSWTPVCTTDAPDMNYLDLDTDYMGLESNTKYSFTVRCSDSPYSERMLSGYDTTGVSVKYYDTPFIYCIANNPEGLEIYWTEVEGVAKYRIFEWYDGGWKKLGDTADTAILVTGLNYGSNYWFTVRGLDKNGNFITPYDSAGRENDWLPDYTGKPSYDPDFQIISLKASAQERGFNTDESTPVDLYTSMIYLLDSDAFYGDTGNSINQYVYNRGINILNTIVKMMKRNGLKTSDYACSFETDTDEYGYVYIYFVFARIMDEE